MEWIKSNKELLLKYLYIFISNILIYIFSNFYFRNIEFKDLIMLIVIVIIDYIIYLKDKSEFILYFDLITNFLVGIVLMFFSKDNLTYGMSLFSVFFANNIIFVKSRLSEKFIKRNFQYLMMFLYTILSMFINLCIFYFI